MEKSWCYRFQPCDYELLMILFRFITGMGSIATNIRNEDLYGDKEPWELFHWDAHYEKYHYFFTQLKRKSKSASRFDRTVGKRGGTWHGQDKGKPIIHKRTKALFGYKRSFLYQNKNEPEQDRQWLLKEFYLSDAVIKKATEMYPVLEHTKDFVLCRLQRKKRAGQRQESESYDEDVPVEMIIEMLKGEDSTETSPSPPTEEQNGGGNYYMNPTEEILAQPAAVVQESTQGENVGLLLDGGIVNEDYSELLAIQQRLMEDDDEDDIFIDDDPSYLDGLTVEILQEPSSLRAIPHAGQGGKCLSSHIN